ncbi:glutathione S-transferase [Blakeslea trispora]|nr:glutathione S-transferase [Blakeslea trispora]
MTKKYIFYDDEICPYAQRAHIALKEVGAEYERVKIDLLNKPEWYKDINPEGKIPCLNIDGYNLAESMVIVNYLLDSYPEKNLMPNNPIQCAQIRYAIEFFHSAIAMEYLKFIVNNKAENARVRYEEVMNKNLRKFDELLKTQSPHGPYFLGEAFSMADIAIAPFLARMRATNHQMGFSMDVVKESPRLYEYIQGCTSRPSFKETYCGDEPLIEFKKKKFDYQV